MSLWTTLGFKQITYANNELPEIFPLAIREIDFVRTDVKNIFSRILTDVLERTTGIPEKQQSVLWDNCVASESTDGLVSMLAMAMSDKKDLFLVYKKELGLIRRADSQEEIKIRDDYKKQGKSSVGVFVSFKNYTRSDMVKLYSALEFCAVGGLHKSMNLSKAIQLKLTDLRASVGLSDSADVKTQAIAIAEGLKKGCDVMLDAKDTLETAKPDLTATNSAMEFIAKKQSFYLGMPASYITGEAAKGLGDSGLGEAKAIERGLKNYYFSVIKPVVEVVFSVTTQFKSEDFDQITSSLETLKTFELTSDEYLSKENKQIIVNKMFGLPEDEVGDEPVEVITSDPLADPTKKVPEADPVSA